MACARLDARIERPSAARLRLHPHRPVLVAKRQSSASARQPARRISRALSRAAARVSMTQVGFAALVGRDERLCRRRPASARRCSTPPHARMPTSSFARCSRRIVARSGRFQLRHRRQHRGDDARVGVVRASASGAASDRSGSCVPRMVASPARTLQCGSGSSPDSTVRNVSSSRFANPCRAASLTVGSGSPRKSTNDVHADVCGGVPQREQRLRARRRMKAACIEQFRQHRLGALASPMRPSARIASMVTRARRARRLDQRQQHRNRRGVAQRAKALDGKRPACTPAARRESVNSAGNARLSSMRCSA